MNNKKPKSQKKKKHEKYIATSKFFSDTIAFHTVLTSYSSISEGSPVLFNEVLLNQGDG